MFKFLKKLYSRAPRENEATAPSRRKNRTGASWPPPDHDPVKGAYACHPPCPENNFGANQINNGFGINHGIGI